MQHPIILTPRGRALASAVSLAVRGVGVVLFVALAVVLTAAAGGHP